MRRQKGKGLNRIRSEDLGYPLLVSFSLSISLSHESDPVPSNFSFPPTPYLPGNTKMLWKAAAIAAVVGEYTFRLVSRVLVNFSTPSRLRPVCVFLCS